jgi:hypothetical protein
VRLYTGSSDADRAFQPECRWSAVDGGFQHENGMSEDWLAEDWLANVRRVVGDFDGEVHGDAGLGLNRLPVEHVGLEVPFADGLLRG